MPDTDITLATLQSFHLNTYTADILPDNSLNTLLQNIPVSRHLSPASLTSPTGIIRVATLILDANNPSDCLIVGVIPTGSPIGATPNSCAAGIFNSASQSIPNATQTALTFTSVEFDTLATSPAGPSWSSTTPTNLVLNVPGVYVVSCSIEFAANNTGLRVVSLYDTLANQFFSIDERPAVQGDTTDFSYAAILHVTNPTAVQAYVYQNSGGALGINAGAGQTKYSPYLRAASCG